MTHSCTGAPSRRALTLALLGATLTMSLSMACAPTAHAEGWGEQRREREEHRERQWDHDGRREGYYRRPDLSYSAPPVMVYHPDYYRRPEPGISFNLPFFYR